MMPPVRNIESGKTELGKEGGSDRRRQNICTWLSERRKVRGELLREGIYKYFT